MEWPMGGNGSYSPSLKGVASTDRTHYEATSRIDGHKILIQKKSIYQNKTPLNSNSDNPVYLCGKVDKKTGDIKITTIAEYKNHRLVKTIDLVFDKNGNYVGYHGDGKGSHSHRWKDDLSKNEIGRKSHKKDNILPVPKEYKSLINKITNYNKENHKWSKEKSQ